MTTIRKSLVFLGGCCLFMGTADSRAAASFSNSLTGFTGDSSLAATRNALTAAGLEVSDITTANRKVVFANTGVKFGSAIAGDEGKNYVRTIAADYAGVNFEAFITIVVPAGATSVPEEKFAVWRGSSARRSSFAFRAEYT